MTAKDYLSQAWRVDRMVSAKLEQVKALHLLAEKATATLSDMPRKPAPNTHRMEDIIVKIVDLDNGNQRRHRAAGGYEAGHWQGYQRHGKP